MPITSLKIKDFRNLAEVELAPTLSGLNIISGKNGSGKTSLLEAIYYLGLGRSFRSSQALRLIRHDASKFSIFAQLQLEDECFLPIGLERDVTGVTRLRMNETDMSNMTEFAQRLPLLIINSHSHQLFESGPLFRRKYLDWGLFYLDDNFLPCWRQYERVLKQRNAVLKSKRPKNEADSWTTELIKYGLDLNKMRLDYLQALFPYLIEKTRALLGEINLSIHYHPGWDEKLEFADVLSQQFPEDFRFGHTQAGPHRADIDVQIDGIPVKHFLSRGQQKLLICAMILAQGMLLMQKGKRGLIYLVDDLPSELDRQSRERLISLLSQQQAQVFITAIESNMICDDLIEPGSEKVFHVEHGQMALLSSRLPR